MKLLTIILFASIALSLSGCKGEDAATEETTETTVTTTTETDTTTDTTTTETETEIETEIITETETETEIDITASIIITETVPATPPAKPAYVMASAGPSGVRFFNGTTWDASVYEKQAGPSAYMAGVEIHTLNQTGESVSMIYAPESGDLIKKISDGFILCDIIQPTESSALGARPAVYSQVHRFQAGVWVEPKAWYLQKWTCSKIIETASGDIIIKDTLNRFWPVNSTKKVFAAADSGLLVHSYNGSTKTAIFEDAQGPTNQSWALNYISGSKDWLGLQGTYYAYNGYEYSFSGGLLERVNKLMMLQVWPYLPSLNLANGERPTLVPSGSDPALNVIYWIECNTGWLVEYRIGTGQLVSEKRLFVGDGLMITGMNVKKNLRNLKKGNKIYFNHSGSTQVLDLSNGSVNIFFNGVDLISTY